MLRLQWLQSQVEAEARQVVALRAFHAVAGTMLAAILGSGPARAETLAFRGACFPGPRVLVAGVGDLLFHEALQRRALAPGGSYNRFWQPVAPVIQGADIAYANLEGPAAHGVAPAGYAVKDPGRRLDGRVYGTTPGALIFNYHPSVAADIKAAGFAVVSTANNHAADRGPLGIDRTIDNLDKAGLAFTGTRRRGGEARPWSVITRARGMTVAWLACSYSTNGMPDPHGQVLNCYDGQETVLDEIRTLWDEPDVDAVIVTPHWGVEGSHRPLESDRAWARAAIEAGATAVIGTHPHVLQPWERHVAGDGREALIIYSTGNFVSNQASAAQRTGLIALLSLVRGPTGKAEVAAAGYVLTAVDPAAGHRVAELVGDPAIRGSQLAEALRLLPAGNRVPAAGFRQLPEVCEEPLIASLPAPGTAVASATAAAPPAPPSAPPAPPTGLADAAPPAQEWRLAVASDTPDGQASDPPSPAPPPAWRLAVSSDTPDGQASEPPSPAPAAAPVAVADAGEEHGTLTPRRGARVTGRAVGSLVIAASSDEPAASEIARPPQTATSLPWAAIATAFGRKLARGDGAPPPGRNGPARVTLALAEPRERGLPPIRRGGSRARGGRKYKRGLVALGPRRFGPLARSPAPVAGRQRRRARGRRA